MSTLNYKGFVANIEYNPEINQLCGTVINSAPHTFYGKPEPTVGEGFSAFTKNAYSAFNFSQYSV